MLRHPPPTLALISKQTNFRLAEKITNLEQEVLICMIYPRLKLSSMTRIRRLSDARHQMR